MERVVVTGLGIVSSIGNSCRDVARSLREGSCGMRHMAEMERLGFRCCVAAPVVNGENFLHAADHLSVAARYALTAALEAAAEAGLRPHSEEMERCGSIIGTGGGGESRLPLGEDGTGDHGNKRRGEKGTGEDTSSSPVPVPGYIELMRLMNSTAAHAVAAHFGARGRTQSLSAACASGLYNIGRAYELIQDGHLERCFCGGAEEQTWTRVGVTADNTKGMPTDYNDHPERACRPFDRDRQGFVISEGAGVLVLESYAAARRRGADIIAEVVGYAAANDGADMFVATGDGMRRAILESMRQASTRGVSSIDYINAHAAGTPTGDPIEAGVLREIFAAGPAVSSTKGHTGHSQGAIGAQEAVLTLLMLRENFIAATRNLEHVAEDCRGLRHVSEQADTRLTNVLTLNNGLGGTNACLVLRKEPSSERGA